MSRCLTILLFLSAACGDGNPSGTDQCGFVDNLLPYEVGYSWTYRVTNLTTGKRTIKRQRLERLEDHADYGPVIVQITEKAAGRTESYLRRDGDMVLRFEQTDYDQDGVLERVTTYDPPRLRIDEALAVGERFTETYTATRVSPGKADTVIETTDVWDVEGDSEACQSGLGDFTCTKYRRVRTQGGVAAKDFYFAAGIGKVLEDGTSRLEALESCEIVE